MVFDGNIIAAVIRDLNVVNKFDAIVMNPLSGNGGKTAVDHLQGRDASARWGAHLALLPTGPAADKGWNSGLTAEKRWHVLVTGDASGSLGRRQGTTRIMFGGFGGVLAQEMIVWRLHSSDARRDARNPQRETTVVKHQSDWQRKH